MRPIVSVIVPVYNSEKTLKQCLNSVLKQEYKNYEVLVVDNNSTDKSKQIIENIQKKDRKVKYLFEQKKGVGPARNTGEKKAKGNIILMTDSDCIVPKNWISKMIKAIGRYDAIQGFEQSVFDNFWSRYRQVDSKKKYEKEDMENPLGKIDTKNLAVKKKVLKKIGYTSRKYQRGNDTDISIKLFKNNCKVGFTKNIRVKHFHPDSLKKVFKKQIYRGRGTVIITKNNLNFLKNTSFLRDTGQTPWAFIRFFPGLIGIIVRKNIKYAYYNLISGLSWRVGLIYGWLMNPLSPKGKASPNKKM